MCQHNINAFFLMYMYIIFLFFFFLLLNLLYIKDKSRHIFIVLNSRVASRINLSRRRHICLFVCVICYIVVHWRVQKTNACDWLIAMSSEYLCNCLVIKDKGLSLAVGHELRKHEIDWLQSMNVCDWLVTISTEYL